jgi:hypothetical protein
MNYGHTGKRLAADWRQFSENCRESLPTAGRKEKPRRLAKPRGGFEEVSGRREKPEVPNDRR